MTPIPQNARGIIVRVGKSVMKAPIHLYRWTFKPLIGWPCRHLPTCSEYGLDAIERNGAWRGGWLTFSRVCRCHPWGTDGFDPAPDITCEHHPLTPWRYGRWTSGHLKGERCQTADTPDFE